MVLLILLAIQIGCMVFCWKSSRWTNWIALMVFQLICVVFSYFGVCKYNWGGFAHFGDFLLYAISLCAFFLIFMITLFLAIANTPSRKQKQEEEQIKAKSKDAWPPLVQD